MLPKSSKQREANELQLLATARIPKLLRGSSPFPTYMIRKLSFFEPALILQGAVTFVLKEWRINSAFDPDAALGGGTVAGYNEMAKIYNAYRVENVKVRYNVASNEPSIPIVFGCIFRDIQPSTKILLYADAQNALEVAPTSGPQIVGTTQGMSIYRSPWYKIHPGDIVGDRLQYASDTQYTSVVTTNPAQLLWMSLIALSATGGNLTNGIIYTMYFEFTVRFFSGQVVLE